MMLNFKMYILKKGSSNTKSLGTLVVRPVLEYGPVCWDLFTERQINALNWGVQKKAKFSNLMSDLDWEMV
jgi:hypothetical protein